jgi:hypothetical protein
MPRKTASLRFEPFPRLQRPMSGNAAPERASVELEKGTLLLHAFAAIVAAAVLAGGITILSAPVDDVVASPLPPPATVAITTCKQRPWPYLNCVGTEFGDPRVRVISFNRPTR